MSIATAPGVVQRLERRRRCAHQQWDVEQLRAFHREIARRVAESVLLFERSVVLFVDNDQPEAREGHEDRAASSDQHARVAAAARVPRLCALAFGQAGVIHRRVAEATGKALERLRGQRDFGDQHQYLVAAGEDGLDRLQINLGLAAARDAVQQQTFEAPKSCAHSSGRGELLPRQFEISTADAQRRRGRWIRRFDETLGDQTVQRLCVDARAQQRVVAGPAAGGAQFEPRSALPRSARERPGFDARSFVTLGFLGRQCSPEARQQRLERATLSQRHWQRGEQRLTGRVVVVVGCPSNQFEHVGLQDRLRVDDVG